MDDHSSTDAPQLAYAGGAEEYHSGCYYLGGRLYSPAARRFACADPLSPFDEGGFNRYAYCGGDPIGRIDPSGGAWWDWLIAGVGLVAAVAGTIATGGALAGVLGAAAAGSLTASMSTASMVGLAVAATADVAAVGVELGSVVAMATDNDELNNVLGWVSIGTGAASLGLSVLARTAGRSARAVASTRASGPRSRAGAWSGMKRWWSSNPADQPLPPVVRGRQIRGWDRLGDDVSVLTGSLGEYYLEPAWYRVRRKSRYPGAVHFGADSKISAHHVVDVIQRNAARYPGPITVYSGAHGRADGQNWRLGGRRLIAPRLMVEDMEAVSGAVDGLDQGRIVRFANFADITPATAMMSFAEPGLHIHATCYGAVDEVLLSMFKHAPVPVYEL